MLNSLDSSLPSFRDNVRTNISCWTSCEITIHATETIYLPRIDTAIDLERFSIDRVRLLTFVQFSAQRHSRCFDTWRNVENFWARADIDYIDVGRNIYRWTCWNVGLFVRTNKETCRTGHVTRDTTVTCFWTYSWIIVVFILSEKLGVFMVSPWHFRRGSFWTEKKNKIKQDRTLQSFFD